MEEDEIIISIDVEEPEQGKKKKKNKKEKSKQKNKSRNKVPKTRTSKAVQKSSKPPLLKVILIIVLLIIATIVVLHTSLFNIAEIKVEGNDRLSYDKVIMSSKLTLGENLFEHNKKEIYKSLLENPYIESAEIKKKLPKTVEISIVERKVNYMIQFSDTYIYINNQGFILEQTTEKTEVPLIVGFTTDQNSVEVGKRLCDEDLLRMNKIIKIFELAKVNGISDSISKIDISDEKNYVLELEARGKKVNLGDCTNFSDINTKMLYLASILSVSDESREEIFLNVDLNNNKAYSRPMSD